MNELKFNSAVCTSVEQSQRLLDLGLKPETADMAHIAFGGGGMMTRPYDWLCTTKVDINNFYPAWSLHRLLEIICDKECEEHYYFDFSIDYDSIEDVYDSIIEVIERHIKNKFFNKEYLKQCQKKGDTESI